MENSKIINRANYDGKIVQLEVFEDGRIMKDHKLLRIYDNGAGYLSIDSCYRRNEKGTLVCVREYIHRIVAQTFLDNPDNLPQVNHKDFDKSNNSVSNLEWCSRSSNIQHSHDNGRMNNRYKVGAVTELTIEEVIDCYTRVKSGEGVGAVARSMSKPRTTISSIINKRSRRDITDRLDETLSQPTVVSTPQ